MSKSINRKGRKGFRKVHKESKKTYTELHRGNTELHRDMRNEIIDFCHVPCALRPEPFLRQIYLVIEKIVEMIFQHMIRSDSLNFKTDLIFKIPSSVNRDKSFRKI
jgi:hypothetical protein